MRNHLMAKIAQLRNQGMPQKTGGAGHKNFCCLLQNEAPRFYRICLVDNLALYSYRTSQFAATLRRFELGRFVVDERCFPALIISCESNNLPT